MCFKTGWAACVLLALCCVTTFPSAYGKNTEKYEVKISKGYCRPCLERPDLRGCPNLTEKTEYYQRSMVEELLVLIEAINRTKERWVNTTSSSDFLHYNISDFHDVFNPKAFGGRYIRKRATKPEAVFHGTSMALVMIQAYMDMVEEMVVGPAAQDMSDINNKTRVLRCNVMDYTANLAVKPLKKKFCSYKPQPKILTGKSERQDYFLSVIIHGRILTERVLREVEGLSEMMKECKLKNCDSGKGPKLSCKAKKRTRSLNRRKKGKKDRKNRKGRKGKNGNKGQGRKSKKCRKSQNRRRHL